MPPDDLPRSRIGRVPQWVTDEAAGGSQQPPSWREHPATAGPPGPGGRPHTPAVRAGFAAALVLGILVAVGIGVATSPDRGQAFAQSLEGWARLGQSSLLPASQRQFPVAGVEEGPTRLAPAPATGTAAGTGTPAGAYAFIGTQPTPDSTDSTGSPVAWSPCRPIHYVIDPTGAPPGFADHVRVATAELTAATGLVFVDDGVTSEPPTLHRRPFQPEVYGDRWAPVLIRWADSTAVPALAGSVAGVAAAPSAMDPTTGTWHYVSGAVLLDTELLAAPSTTGEPVYLPILRHELGHLLGLAHVEDVTQLMHPMDQGLGTFRDGDLTGLAELGRGPCAPGL